MLNETHLSERSSTIIFAYKSFGLSIGKRLFTTTEFQDKNQNKEINFVFSKVARKWPESGQKVARKWPEVARKWPESGRECTWIYTP